MTAIGIAQALGSTIKFGKHERGITAFRGVLKKKLVYRAKESRWLFKGNGALASQICLQVGHE